MGRWGCFLWGLLSWTALIVGFGSWRYVMGDPHDFAPAFQDRYMRLLPLVRFHGVLGVLALCLGPALLNQNMLSEAPRLHRFLGKLYLLAVLGAGTSGLGLAGTSPHWGASTGFATLALLWLVTGALAWRAALGRRWADHQEWMWRNYALTYGAVMLRLYGNALGAMGADYGACYPFLAWLSWVPNLLIVQGILTMRTRKGGA